MVNLTADERELLEDFDAEETRALERQQSRTRDHDFPEPEAQDILEIKDALEADFDAYRYGTMLTVGEEGEEVEDPNGVPGLERIRAMRYHRDKMPSKWADMLQVPYRFRSNFTANEIERTVALATRNPPKVTIPPASADPEDRERAERETRACNELLPFLERSVNEPLMRIFADALFEGGLAVWEPYVTGAYDDVDFDEDPREDEDEDEFQQRKDEELSRAGLPFGVRVPDTMSVLYDVDDEGVYVAMVVERKSYRRVHNRLHRRLSPKRIEELRLPRPGDRSWPSGPRLTYSDRFGSPNGSVECVRYYDRNWYAYMVAGQIVEVERHGHPQVPIIPAWGTATGASDIAEKLHGVAWGMVEQEQALNDLMTTEVDIGITFGRPKPVIVTPPDGSLRSGGAPSVLKLDGPGVPELMPGQQIVDAFQGFQSRITADLLNTIMAIRQRSSLNPAAQGESPGADPSGFAINSLQAAAQMKYEILLDNYARSLGLLIDHIRRMIKYGPIGEKVFLTAHSDEGAVEFLALDPDDISDVPCEVSIDPMNDVNRLAIRDSLMEGQARGFVPRRIVQTLGYGAEDPKRWDEEIAEDAADVQLMGLALEDAKALVFLESQGVQPQLYGPNGEDPEQFRRQQQQNGGEPAEPRGATVGRELSTAQGGGQAPQRNSARARGGQQPSRQGAPALNGRSP